MGNAQKSGSRNGVQDNGDDLPHGVEIALAQYEVGAELYRHEDGLNWQKLNFLLLVNAGLWIAVGFVMEPNGSEKTLPVPQGGAVAILSGVGLFVSLAFGVSIWYGVKYLLARKRAIFAIERRLMDYGGLPLMQEAAATKRFLERSPTIWLLRFAPWVMSGAWVVLIAVGLRWPGGG